MKKKTVTLKLSARQNYQLYLKNSKGMVIEDIVEQVLIEAGADEICRHKDLDKQLILGDIEVVKNNKSINVEVKSSCSYNNTDKLAIDLEYFNFSNGEIVPYIQRTSNTSKGWLYCNLSDWLIAFNVDSSKLYIIKQFQLLKQKIKEQIEEHELYLSLFSEDIMKVWTDEELRYINSYLTCGVKKDTTKYTRVVFLELSAEALKYYNVKYDIIDVVIEIKKPFNVGSNERLN